MNKAPSQSNPLDILAWVFLAFIFIYTVIRAAFLPVFHDEAVTVLYLCSFKYLEIMSYYMEYFTSTNHILNTVLMKFCLKFFPYSELAARVPALIGHALYLIGIYKISGLILGKRRIWGVIILSINPFMLDLFSAARGYSLGLGFLSVGLWQFFESIRLEGLDARRCFIRAGACLMMATYSNFIFVYIYAPLMAYWLIFEIQFFRQENKTASIWRFFLSHGNKLIFLNLIIAGDLMARPLKILQGIDFRWFGGDTGGFWPVTIVSLIKESFYGRDTPFLLVMAQAFVVGVVLAGLVCVYIFIFRGEKLSLSEKYLGKALSLLLVVTFLLMAHSVICGRPFIEGRYALYLIPLFLLLFITLVNHLSQQSFKLLTTALTVPTLFFMLVHFSYCLNFQYFNISRWSTDAREAVHAMMNLTVPEKKKLRDSVTVRTHWLYTPMINFYREKYRLYWLEFCSYRQGLKHGYDYYYFDPSLTSSPDPFLQSDFREIASNDVVIVERFSFTQTFLAKRIEK